MKKATVRVWKRAGREWQLLREHDVAQIRYNELPAADVWGHEFDDIWLTVSFAGRRGLVRGVFRRQLVEGIYKWVFVCRQTK